jgi:hypothetical protein
VWLHHRTVRGTGLAVSGARLGWLSTSLSLARPSRAARGGPASDKEATPPRHVAVGTHGGEAGAPLDRPCSFQAWSRRSSRQGASRRFHRMQGRWKPAVVVGVWVRCCAGGRMPGLGSFGCAPTASCWMMR